MVFMQMSNYIHWLTSAVTEAEAALRFVIPIEGRIQGWHSRLHGAQVFL